MLGWLALLLAIAGHAEPWPRAYKKHEPASGAPSSWPFYQTQRTRAVGADGSVEAFQPPLVDAACERGVEFAPAGGDQNDRTRAMLATLTHCERATLFSVNASKLRVDDDGVPLLEEAALSALLRSDVLLLRANVDERAPLR